MGELNDKKKLYDFLYSGKYVSYGPSCGLKQAPPFVEKYFNLKGAEVLDFGCGKGEFVKWLNEQGYNAEGMDIIDSNLVLPEVQPHYWQMDKYVISDFNEFDYLTCFDVLEHLEETEVKTRVMDFRKWTIFIALISVSHRDTRVKGPYGEQLHLTIKPIEWWRDVFKAASFRIVEELDCGDGSTLFVLK